MPVVTLAACDRNRGAKGIDIEPNKLGSIISLLASQEATALHPRGLEHCFAKGIDTPPPHLPYWLAGGHRGKCCWMLTRGLSV